MQLSAKERIIRIVLFVFSIITLAAQFAILQKNVTGLTDFISHTITFFSYMTILTNTLVALVYIVPVLFPRSRFGKFLFKPFAQTATLVYIVIVCIAYHILLARVWNPQGLQKAVDISLHYAVPVLYTLFWFLFVQKGPLKYSYAFVWLIYPAVYLIYAMLRGSYTGIYPYYFLDIQKNSAERVLTVIAILLCLYLVTGFIFIFIYHRKNMHLKF